MNISQWDLKRYLNKSFNSKFDIVELGNHIVEESRKYDISDPTKQYGILGVNNQTGIFDSYSESGNKIRQKYKRMETGWIAYNPYRINVGSIGIKKQEHKHEYISPAYVVFSCQPSLSPEYLFLTMKTPVYNKVIRDNTTGSVRQNLSYDILKNLQIPLPSLEMQQALVKAYNDKIQQATEQERQAEEVEHNIEDYLLAELGIKPQRYTLQEPSFSMVSDPQVEYATSHQQNAEVSATYKWGDEINKEYLFLKFIRFKEINEWGYYLMTNHKSISSLYPTKKVKDICSLGSGGTPSRSIPKYYQGNIPWIKTGEVVNDLILDTEEHISLDAIENSSAKLYPKGSLIIAMYGQGDTRGRTAKMGMDATTNQACAVLYNINNELVTTDYLWYYFQGQYNDLRSLASGNNQPNLNAGKIYNYDVVIPPLEIQNTIVEHINEQKAQIKKLKKQAEELRKEALEDFEKEIFE